MRGKRCAAVPVACEAGLQVKGKWR